MGVYWYKYNQYLQLMNAVTTDTNTLSVKVNNARETVHECVAHRHISRAGTNYYTEHSNRVTITAEGMS